MVFKTYILGAAAALMCSGVGIAAQSTTTTQQPRAQQSSERKTSTILTGCVYQEKDVPGRAPNPAERAGILEDYILAEVQPGPSSARSTATTGTSGAATTGTSGVKSGAMYKLEKVKDDQLKELVGKRVEVTGRIDAEAGDAKNPGATAPKTSATDRVIGHDRVDLPEFEVESIREVSGTCPAKPSSR